MYDKVGKLNEMKVETIKNGTCYMILDMLNKEFIKLNKNL